MMERKPTDPSTKEVEAHWSIYRTIKRVDNYYNWCLAVLYLADPEDEVMFVKNDRKFFNYIIAFFNLMLTPALMLLTLPIISFVFIVRTLYKAAKFKLYTMGFSESIVSGTGKFSDYRRYCKHRKDAKLSIVGFYVVAEKYKFIIANLTLTWVIYWASIYVSYQFVNKTQKEWLEFTAGAVTLLANVVEVYQSQFERRDDIADYFEPLGIKEEFYDNPFTSRMTVEDQLKEIWKGHFILYTCKNPTKKVLMMKKSCAKLIKHGMDYIMREIAEERLLRNRDHLTIVLMDDNDYHRTLDPIQCKVVIQGKPMSYAIRKKLNLKHIIHVLLQKLTINRTILDLMSIILLLTTVIYFFTDIQLLMRITVATLLGIFLLLAAANFRSEYTVFFVNTGDNIYFHALGCEAIEEKNNSYGFHGILNKILPQTNLDVMCASNSNSDVDERSPTQREAIKALQTDVTVFTKSMLSLLCMLNYNPYKKGIKFKDFILLLKIIGENCQCFITVEVDHTTLASNAFPEGGLLNINIKITRDGNMTVSTTPVPKQQVTKDFDTFLFELYENELHYDFYVV